MPSSEAETVMQGAQRWFSISLVAGVLFACASAADQGQPTGMPTAGPVTDFATLAPPDRPNHWLVAPVPALAAAPVAGKPDAAAPVFDVPAARLAHEWIAIVERQPRAKVLAVSDDGLRVEAEQTSAVFGFRDRISARFVPLAAERSTLIAFSTAEIGYWDLGVNRARLQSWIDLLTTKVAASAK